MDKVEISLVESKSSNAGVKEKKNYENKNNDKRYALNKKINWPNNDLFNFIY